MSFMIGTAHTHNAGYYRNDDTPSGGGKVEADVQTCTHCQRVLLMQGWKEDGGWCGKCSAPICGPCADRMVTHGCEPFMQQLEAGFDHAVRLAAFRKLAGLDTAPPQALILP